MRAHGMEGASRRSVRVRTGHQDDSALRPRAPLSVAQLIAMQRSVGNRAARAVVQRRDEERLAGGQVRSVLQSEGDPLDSVFQARAEQFLGADLSNVRVHTGAAAADSARAVQSLAYTSGANVVFDHGMYDTRSAAGQRRLVHELTHVVQQRHGPVPGTSTAAGLSISDPSDRLERAAEQSGAAFVTDHTRLDTGSMDSDVVGSNGQPTSTHEFTSVSLGAFPVQRMKLTGSKGAQMKNKLKAAWGDEAEDVFAEFVDWCHSTLQADEILKSLTLEQWSVLSLATTGEAAYTDYSTSTEAYEAVKAAGTRPSKTSDPLAAVKAKVRAERRDPGKFSDEELRIIEAGKDQDGWAAAIQSVWQQKIHREESQRLSGERQVKYAAAKLAGDRIFSSGLLKAVWLVAYEAAVSGDASPNTTVARPSPDAEILPAVTGWRRHRRRTLGQGQGQVTTFYVPGGEAPIEDKSRRLHNPDPTRGRQADFISTWGKTEINVHVDAIPQH